MLITFPLGGIHVSAWAEFYAWLDSKPFEGREQLLDLWVACDLGTNGV